MPISQNTDPNQWPDRFLVMLADAMHRAELLENAGETPDYNILPYPKSTMQRGDGDVSVNAMLHVGILELVQGVEGDGTDVLFIGTKKAVITPLARSLMSGEYTGEEATAEIPFDARDSAPARGRDAAPARAPKAPRQPKPEGESAPRAPRKGSLAGKRLYATVDKNPRAAGSFGYKSMQIIMDTPGIVYEKYIEAGGRQKDFAWDVDHNWAEARDE